MPEFDLSPPPPQGQNNPNAPGQGSVSDLRNAPVSPVAGTAPFKPDAGAIGSVPSHEPNPGQTVGPNPNQPVVSSVLGPPAPVQPDQAGSVAPPDKPSLGPELPAAQSELPPVKSGRSGMWKIFIALGLAVVLTAIVYAFVSLPSLRGLIGLDSPDNLVLDDQDQVSDLDDLGFSEFGDDFSDTSLNNGVVGDLSQGRVPVGQQNNTSSNLDNQRKNDLSLIQSYLEAYFTDKGAYPVAGSFIKTSDPSSVLQAALLPSYASQLPDDPNSGQGWWYGYRSVDGASYELTARLENEIDPQGVKDISGLTLYKLNNPR